MKAMEGLMTEVLARNSSKVAGNQPQSHPDGYYASNNSKLNFDTNKSAAPLLD